MYEGEFADDVANGQGKFTWKNGDVYEGEWKEGRRHGEGSCFFAVASTEYPVKASEIYEGSWQRGKFHGQGKLFMADGSTREGTWVRNSLREGVGKTYFDSGDVYEGGMVKETMHGMGTYTHADGSVFVGEFVDNLAQGHGRITFAGDSLDYPARAGDRFEGSWQRGAWHGKGTLTRADGTVVEGTWVGNRLVEST